MTRPDRDHRHAARRSWGAGIAALIALAMVGRDLSAQQPAAGEAPRTPARAVAGTGIENLFRLEAGLFSGGLPGTAEDYEALRRLGVRTVICVDGPPPRTELARRAGLRTVHVPVGYDGVDAKSAARLIQAARRGAAGAVYVHCHHGKHRGPAAAALCGMALHGWSRDRATAWLEQAGTSHDYPGLYEAIYRFVPPSDADLAAIPPEDLDEVAEVPALVDLMGRIDTLWDTVKASRKRGRAADPGGAADPARAAVLLSEALAEAARLPECREHGEEFHKLLDASRQRARELADALKPPQEGAPPGEQSDLSRRFDRVGESCTSCHRRFRDRASGLTP